MSLPEQEPFQLVEKRKREINWMYVTPMFLMALPLIRIIFRKQPALRDRLFYGGIAVGLIHGTWLIARSQPEDHQEQFYGPPKVIKSAAAGTVATAGEPADKVSGASQLK